MNNLYDDIPDDLTNELFEQLVDSDHVRIERIISRGHRSPESGWYDQDRSEWVVVLRGESVLSFEDGTSVSLKAGDYINIAAHRKHRVEWTAADVETIWLAIHYSP